MISEVLAIVFPSKQRLSDRSWGVSLHILTHLLRADCKERREGGGNFRVSLGILSMVGSDMLEVAYFMSESRESS